MSRRLARTALTIAALAVGTFLAAPPAEAVNACPPGSPQACQDGSATPAPGNSGAGVAKENGQTPAQGSPTGTPNTPSGPAVTPTEPALTEPPSPDSQAPAPETVPDDPVPAGPAPAPAPLYWAPAPAAPLPPNVPDTAGQSAGALIDPAPLPPAVTDDPAPSETAQEPAPSEPASSAAAVKPSESSSAAPQSDRAVGEVSQVRADVTTDPLPVAAMLIALAGLAALGLIALRRRGSHS